MDGVQTCKNCDSTFSGTYCNACGQKAAHRLTTGHVIHEAIHVFTHTDKGIFSFIPVILFRPGQFALDYVNGKRKRYFNVFQYLIILVGLVTYLMIKSNYLENISQTLSPTSPSQSMRVQVVQKQLTAILQQYMNILLFVLLPVFSFFSWLVFRSKKYNYAENVVLLTAIQAQINTYILLIVTPLAFLLTKDQHKILLPITILLFMTCITIGNKQFFKVSWIQAFFKGLAVYILTNIVQAVITIGVSIILIMNYKK